MSELRETVLMELGGWFANKDASFDDCVDQIAAILEDTGAPAYMRVAADLRGEVARED